MLANRCWRGAGGIGVTARRSYSIIGSILHGSGGAAAAKESDQEETTHSKLLSRGKFVHKLQTHNVKPEAWDDYVGLVSENYARVNDNPDFKVKLFGSFSTEIGKLDQALHIWEYNKYKGYDETYSMLEKDEVYQNFIKKLRPMLRSRESQMMLEFAFWQGSSPSYEDGIYELRTYHLKVT
ncbi:hypothetical protein HK101_002309 [Irineochytrium annulatum]|nr:hypothetical protein HK101_002309 [Irineochytrium annulatum]